MRYTNQKGAAPLLVLLAVIGVIGFLAVSTYAPFQDKLLSSLYPKHDSHALSNPVVTQPVQMVEQANLPQPRNVKVWPDDRVATISWDAPDNTTGIVGYIVFYGKTSDGAPTLSKQTIHKAVQIQPVENGVEYTVQVRSVKGRERTGPNPHTAEFGELNTYAVADGPVSPAVSAKVTPSDARVNAMRSRLTGFFDDFNLPAGPFDEKKWNHGTNGCVAVGEDGQFINNQFHAHNMTFGGGLNELCGLNGNVSRPREVFNTAGATEANPAQIEMDVDGITGLRDVWYIDLIPTTARKNGIPMDVTSHDDLGDEDHQDPGNMIRIAQKRDGIGIHYYDINRNPTALPVVQSGMPCPVMYWGNDGVDPATCDMTRKTPGFSPLAQPDFGASTIPNVRRHWVIQYSPQKIKIFIDGTLIASANTPAGLQNTTKFWVHSTIFGYSTGKNYDKVMPTTIMFHWDNFGFTGPVPTTVTHNYLDGGPDGRYPLMGVGMPGHTVQTGNRSTKIPVPDQIGSPVGQARLVFTMHPQGYSSYQWNSNHHIMVNGRRYNFENPQNNLPTPAPDIASTTRSHSTGILVNPADLKTGMNDITFNLDTDIINAHIEIDYNKNNAPIYTQPKQVFNTIDFTPVIQPAMRPSDDYWFVEQYMGLAATVPHNSPAPSATPTPQPSPSTSPAKPGDIDGNNRVDIFDYNTLLTNFGKTGSGIQGDFDNNGRVDIFDFNTLLTNFGK